MSPQPHPRWPILAAALLAGLPAVNALGGPFDHDTWWHLRVGEWVAEHRGVPHIDPFAYHGTHHDIPWRAYSWLHELTLFTAYDQLGPTGVYLLRFVLAAFSTGVLFAFAVRKLGAGILSLLPLAMLATVLVPLSDERPWHYTLAFTGLTAWAVTALREGHPARRVWWLPLIFILWANLHIQFVLGWGVLGLACLFPGSAKRRDVILLTAACFLAVLANPYHFGLIIVILQYATQSGPLQLVAELAPPNRTDSWTLAAFALLLGSLVWNLRRRPVDWFNVALIAAGAFFAGRMTRDLWFGALAAIAAAPSLPKGPWKPVAAAVPLVFALAAAVGFVRGFGDPEGDVFPKAAVAWLKAERPGGPIYNDFDWGGYLIWHHVGVTVDGRTNLYGTVGLLTTHATWNTPDGWQHDSVFGRCRTVFAPKKLLLATVLRDRPEWRIAYEDELAVVFVRR